MQNPYKSKEIVIISRLRTKPQFRVDGKSEPIMVVKRGEETIDVKIGDTLKIGPGIYRIIDYVPYKEWPAQPGVYNVSASVKCKLLRGYVLYDFRRFSTYDKATNETIVEFSPETLSYFVISAQEKAQIIEKKREELARRLEEKERMKQLKSNNTDQNKENPQNKE